MSRLRRGWPYVVVVAAPLVLFAPFLVGLRVLYWGTIEFQFYPWQQLAIQSLRAGHLPLWNPLLGNGAPLLANYQSAVLYPPNWLALVLPLDLAQPWLAALHLAWAGAGMVTLTRSLKFPPLAQTVAGLAFGLSQYLVSRVSFLSINATVAWLPWVVCLVEWQCQLARQDAASRRRALAALLLALAVAAQLLAGHAQTTWYTLLLAAAWCGWRLLSSNGARALSVRMEATVNRVTGTEISALAIKPSGTRSRVGARLRSALWCAAPIAVGGLVASAQLWPTAELLQQSPRATAAAFDFVMTYSFSPWRLFTLAAPDILGNPAHGQYFGYGNYWEDAIYFGLLPLLLAAGTGLAALIRLVRRRRSLDPSAPAGLTYFLLAVASVSLLLGLGRNTPVFPFFYWRVPSFNLFQAPTRLMILFIFALALLAGQGVGAWRRPTGGGLYWTRLGAAGALAMALVGLLAWLRVSPATATGLQIQTMGRALTLAGVAFFVAAILSLAHPLRDSRPWSLAVVAFLLADLWLANAGLNPGAPPGLYRRPAVSAQAIRSTLGSHRLLFFPYDDYTVKYGHFVSFKSFGAADLAYSARQSLLANTSAVDGVASANNFDPLLIARYAGLMDVISTTRSAALLQLMDVAVIASPTPLSLDPVATSAAGGVTFYSAAATPKRVWLLRAARTVAGPAEALAALADPGFDPAKTLILEAGDEASAAPLSPFTPSWAAVVLPVSLPQAGWLLLADTYYPGWVAAVDGQPVPVRHGDYAFRAVAVPAGAHTVVFDYQPDSLRVGLRLTGLGGLLLLVLAAWSLDWGRGWRRGSAHG